jgi:hypothetical protein
MFKIVYTVGFVLTLILWITALRWATLVGELAGHMMPGLDAVLTIIWQIILIVLRYTHPGRVISGEYCTEG